MRLSFSATHAVTILMILISQNVAGQGTTPFGLNYNIYKSIPEKHFEGIDTPKTQLPSRASRKISNETVAYNFKSDLTPGKSGTWKTVSPDVDSWFLKLRSSGAYGLALVLSAVELMPEEVLYVYNQHSLRGPYTSHNVPRSGILPLDFLPGDEIMIEYDVPAASKARGNFRIETVSHAYQNIFSRDEHRHKKASGGRYSDSCYLCLEDDAIAKERRAVVKLVVQYENSTKFCTGTLVNNTAGDNTPYILTAEHCVSSQYDADRTVFIFDYEDENCVKQPHRELMLSGAYHRAAVFENDFSLLELYDKPPLEFHPYYAGWDITDQHLNGVTTIHHPQGGPKKVSVSNGKVRTSNLEDGSSRAPHAFWNVVRWDVGATESGSSGAPLLDKNSHVIGTLSGGSSRCDAPYNDYFEKLSASWEASPAPDQQLKYWLDPVNAGVQTLDGSDPFEGIDADCNMISNVKPGEHQTLLPYAGSQGFFSGYNADSLASYAEKFSVEDSATVTGVMLNVGSVNAQSPGGLLVTVHSSKDGIPGPSLSESFVPYYRLTTDSLNYVGFHPYVKLTGEFFIGYTLSYSPQDSFALKQVDWRSDSFNTAFVKLPSGWAPMSTIAPHSAGSSLGITITLCEDNQSVSPPQKTSVSFYPNPVSTVLIGKLPDRSESELSLHVYDLQGQQYNVPYNVYDNSVVITAADLQPGMYIVLMSTLHSSYYTRFVKR